MSSSTSETGDRGWQGDLQLHFACRNNATQLVYEQVKAPLKVQRPFYPEGEQVCHSVMLHTAGGVVGGDRLSFDIQLQSNAQVLLTTAAAGKIYRSNGSEAQQTTQIQVGTGACLEWFPQELIVFNQALYRQEMRVDLAVDARWVGWDLIRFGRTARGESFTAGHWRSQTEVWQNGRPLWCDRQWLPASPETFHSPHGLNGCSVVGSFALIGQPVEPEWVEKARSLWTEHNSDSTHKTGSEIGVTRLMSGLLCRYRGHSTTEARQWLIAVWQLLRPLYAQRPACIPRVWQI